MTPSKNKKKAPDVIIRSAYNREYEKRYKDYGKSLTQQNQTHDADINNIMLKYTRTGILGSGSGTRSPKYGDYTGVDYREMQTKMTQSKEAFEKMPSKIRSKFENRVDLLLDFLADEKNQEEAIKLGLAEKPPEAIKEKPVEVVIKENKPVIKSEAPKGDPKSSGP